MKADWRTIGAVRAVVVGMLVGLVGCAATGGQRVVEAGQSGALAVELVSDLKMRFPMADYSETQAVWDWKVEEAAPEGGHRVRMRLAELKASMVSLTVRLRYDSEEEAGPTENKRLVSYRETWGGYKGQEYVAVLDAAGEVVALEEVGEKLSATMKGQVTNPMFGGYHAGAFFSPERLREYARWSVWRWPGGVEQEAGASWRRQEIVEIPRGEPVVAELVYTVEEAPEGGVVKVALTGSLVEEAEVPEWAKDRPVDGQAWKVLELTRASGRLRYDPGAGQVERYEELLAEVEMGGVPTRRNEAGERMNKMYYLLKETYRPVGMEVEAASEAVGT